MKNNKQRLFDLMEKINEDFIPRSVGIIGTRSTNSENDSLDLNKTYQQSDDWGKPNGLWYQINSNWNNLCNKNNKDTEFYKLKKQDVFRVKPYNIVLDINFSNIIIIDSSDKVDEFSRKFEGNTIYSIKWNNVAKEYKGIEIPNLKNIKHYKWMDGWDISSGCIWDLSVIKNYKANNCEIIK
jgi:hypothetical protein